MSDDEEGQEQQLSDEELDSLLQELEQKADGSGQGESQPTKEAEPEEIDLSELEESLDQTDSPPAKHESEETSPATEQEPNDSPAVEPTDRASDTQTSTGSRPPAIQKGRNAAFKSGMQGLRLAAVVVPTLLAWWVLGSYLGNWISAGWLIALVSGAVIFGLPVGLNRFAKKGTFGAWLGGTGLVILLGLVVPVPTQTGGVIGMYGHWPASTVSDELGKSMAPYARSSGQLLAGPTVAPRKLGRDKPLLPPKNPPD